MNKKDNFNMKLSNKFTLSRALFAPFFFLIYNIPLWTNNELLAKISAFIMLPLFGIFQFTDFLDGYYARKHNEVSDFGKLFDPFADVVLNLTLFVCIMAPSYASGYFESGYLPNWIFLLILLREFTMNFVRMVAVSKGVAIAARKGGKLKTVFYISSGLFAVCIESLLRLGIDLSSCYFIIKTVLIVMFVICFILSYISFTDYLIHFGKLFKNND